MRVDLGGDRARVTEVRLHVPDVDTRLDEVRATRVAQRMRKDPLPVVQQTCGFRYLLHRLPNRRPADPAAATRQEHGVGITMSGLIRPGPPVDRSELRPADGEIGEQRCAGDRRDGHRALPCPFAVDDHVRIVGVVEMAVREVERRRLARPQPEPVERLDQHVGSRAQRPGQAGGRVAHRSHLRLVERDDLPSQAAVGIGDAARWTQIPHRALEGEQPCPPLAERPRASDAPAAARPRPFEAVAPPLPPRRRDRRECLRRAAGLRIVLDPEHGNRTLRRRDAERPGEQDEIAPVRQPGVDARTGREETLRQGPVPLRRNVHPRG